jgi:lipoprotein NlpI
MKPIFFLLFILSCLQLKSQTANEQLINEGVQLHDRGEFEAAIEKYDAVLKTEPANEAARYEKSYSLMN